MLTLSTAGVVGIRQVAGRRVRRHRKDIGRVSIEGCQGIVRGQAYGRRCRRPRRLALRVSFILATGVAVLTFLLNSDELGL